MTTRSSAGRRSTSTCSTSRCGTSRAKSIRHHICYGLNHGPRMTDIPLATTIPWMMRIDAGAYSFEVANPRHQHEWRAWEDVELPDDACLIPGLLGHATNYVEHPILIADMIELYAGIVGREQRHRRCRLWVLVPGHVHPGGAPRRRLGQVRRSRRGCPHRDQPALELRRRCQVDSSAAGPSSPAAPTVSERPRPSFRGRGRQGRRRRPRGGGGCRHIPGRADRGGRR